MGDLDGCRGQILCMLSMCEVMKKTANQIEQGTDTLVTTDDKLGHSKGKGLLVLTT